MAREARGARDVQGEIAAYIQQHFLADRPDIRLTPDLALVDGGILDSIRIFELIGFLRQSFGITIQAKEIVLENFASLTTLTKLVQSKTRAS